MPCLYHESPLAILRLHFAIVLPYDSQGQGEGEAHSAGVLAASSIPFSLKIKSGSIHFHQVLSFMARNMPLQSNRLLLPFLPPKLQIKLV